MTEPQTATQFPGRPVGETTSIKRHYDSQAQAAAAVGIPVQAFKEAKAGGCAGFHHSRVDLLVFLQWWFSRGDEEPGKDWGTELKKAQALRERIKLSEDEKRVVDRGEVVFAISRGMSLLSSILDRKFAIEAPPLLKGCAEPEIKEFLVKALEAAMDAVREELQKLAKEKTE